MEENNKNDIIEHNKSCDMLKDITLGLINFDHFKKENSIKTYSAPEGLTAQISILPENIISTNVMLNKKMEEKVKIFVETLSNNCRNIDFTYFNSNFKTIEFDLSNLSEKTDDEYFEQGNYDVYENRNKIHLYVFSSAYHELMHSASTNFSNKDAIYCGFNMISRTEAVSIANYFNEGYTQLMVEKYFNVPSQGFYDVLVEIAQAIEDIVGEDKMEQLYFKADLKGLIGELHNYNDLDSIMDFFYDVELAQEYIYKMDFAVEENKIDQYNMKYEESMRNVANFIKVCRANKNVEEEDYKKAA